MKTRSNSSFDAFDTISTSEILFADASSPTLAHIKIPLMHVGPNAKGLYWTPEVLKKIAPMFAATAFRYDLGGAEGSSHTPDKLYSPHYDVGWTNKSYYSPKDQTLWVEGDVTHPDVIAKIKRTTSDGKRELNYASMGTLIDPDDVICSICGKNMAGCGHKRNEDYDGKTAYAVPTDVQKALHVALTNAPADTEAVIASAIFQEYRNLRGEIMDRGVGDNDSYTNQQSRPSTVKQIQVQPQQALPMEKFHKDQAGESMQNGPNPTDNLAKAGPSVGAMADEDMPGSASSAPSAPVAGQDDDTELVDVVKALIMEVKALRADVDGMKGGAAGAPAPGMGAEAPAAPAPMPGMGAGPTGEMADIAGKYYKKMIKEVADKSVSLGKHRNTKEAILAFQDMNISQLETLSVAYEGIAPARRIVETANVPEYGAPTAAPAKSEKTFQDMTPTERRQVFGEMGAWDNCFRNPNAVAPQ